MVSALAALVLGLVVLVGSAERFVEGSAITARHFGMPPLLIGMVIIGFGTSAPEMMVSGLAASQGNPGVALGNAYGSNISNIALILGLTAWISPITVQSKVLRKELPVLTLITVLAALQIRDGLISRMDAAILLVVFAGLMAWTIREGLRKSSDVLGSEMEVELAIHEMPLRKALLRLVFGLIFLIISSRILVWGAISIARDMGVSDLLIGLTIVAIGTSLPELASSIVAARKGEHDIALGNILGSNLFNTLAVVGIAGAIHPVSVGPEVLPRDVLFMGVLTLSLFIIGYGFRGPGRINRIEGVVLVTSYLAYLAFLVCSAFA